MKECRACTNLFPVSIVIDGKRRNFSGRKYCLNCVPFGTHNTRKDINIPRRAHPSYSEYSLESKRNMQQYGARRREKMRKRAIEYAGEKCIKCGYCRYIGALEFHHRDSTTKDLGISQMCTYGWSRLKREIDKCDLLCANCHREEEAKLRGIVF